MKNLSILSITLLASAPVMAMEGQWNKEKTEAPVEEPKQSKVPSLANLCLNVLETQGVIEDPQFLLDLPNKTMPERYTTFAWKNATQKIIDAYSDELVEQLFKVDYPAATKAIMAERLTLTETQAQELFELVIDSNNKQPSKHLIACALFEKYPNLQTWENGQKVAELGPITHKVAEHIAQTLTIADLHALYVENKSGLPEQMLNFGNEQVFEQAFYDLGLSNPISLENLGFLLNPDHHPLIFSNSCYYHHTGKLREPVKHGYSIASGQNKSLQNKDGNFVCYLPRDTEYIAISNDKKWCICAAHPGGRLTIIDLQKKSILAQMSGTSKFEYQHLYFDENNQLCSGNISIQLPYFYLENNMSLSEVIGGLLVAHYWNGGECLMSNQVGYSRGQCKPVLGCIGKFEPKSFVINKSKKKKSTDENQKNNSYCSIQ